MKTPVIALWALLGPMSVLTFVGLADDPPQPGASKEKPAPRRFAVVVGINDYSGQGLKTPRERVPSGSERQSWRNLSGAVRDAESMAAMLRERYGFSPQDVTLLTDQQGSREAILSAIKKELVQRVEKDDLAFFYFAGHGSRAPNSASREVDAFDETLVPADVLLGAPEIRDKELHRALLPIIKKGARLVVVLDSCHSGSGVRGEELVDGLTRGLAPNSKDIASLPKIDKALWELGALVLSSTQNDGVAWETVDGDGEPRGAFSWSLLRALRVTEPGRPWEEAFARTRSLLRLESRPQEPVLEGLRKARQSAVFGEGQVSPEEQLSFMAQGQLRDGRVELQGGWAHGLNEGSELVAFGGTDKETRLRVVELVQLVRSLAEVVEPSKAVVEPGTQFKVVRWAIPAFQPLRIWMQEGPVSAREFAERLTRAAKSRGVHQIQDPSEPPHPSHRLRWMKDSWYLDSRGRERVNLGASPIVDEVMAHFEPGDRLFVQLPVPQGLVSSLATGVSEALDRVEQVTEPDLADYHLVGRLEATGQVAEFAWLLRSGVATSESQGLPIRSPWTQVGTDSENSNLRRSLLSLARAAAWHRLEPPPHSEFPYHLEIRSTGAKPQVARELALGQQYDIFLTAEPNTTTANHSQRYVYVFAIDSYGDSYLLFPRPGNVENRFPLQSAGTDAALSASEYVLGSQPSFEVSEPLGTDTFFLLATQEPLWDPWILEFSTQTRSPSRPGSLDQLLWWIGSGRRSPRPLSTPMEWSIERTPYSSRHP